MMKGKKTRGRKVGRVNKGERRFKKRGKSTNLTGKILERYFRSF